MTLVGWLRGRDGSVSHYERFPKFGCVVFGTDLIYKYWTSFTLTVRACKCVRCLLCACARDMLRLFSHAAEVTLQSPNDKERLSALWRDLLRVGAAMKEEKLGREKLQPVSDSSNNLLCASVALVINLSRRET